MKFNYPIKYVAMPIFEKRGFNHDIGPVYYIVSKAYLVSEETCYNLDGKKTSKYQVVFPFQRNDLGEFERNVPKKNYSSGYINSDFVDKVFDLYKEAKDDAFSKNRELFEFKFFLTTNENKKSKIVKYYEEKRDYYTKLEELLLKRTMDLEVNNFIPSLPAIKFFDGTLTIDESIYSVLDSNCKDSYVIYSVALDEYRLLLKSLENSEKKASFDTKLLACHRKGSKNVEIYDPLMSFKYYLNKAKKLISSTDEQISEELPETDNIYFTVETYSDLIRSYEKKDIIDFPPKTNVRTRN